MPTKYPVTPTGNYKPVAEDVTTQLNVSGDSSSCEFSDWFVHTQTINAMYTRRWVYDTNPTLGTGAVASACPGISYNYLDVNYTVQVTETKEQASYCSGLFQPQQLIIDSNSTTGGLGTSGIITTSAIGYSRIRFDPATHSTYTCQRTVNGIIGRQPGEYTPSFDTSASVGSELSDLLYQAMNTCDRFNMNLVEY